MALQGGEKVNVSANIAGLLGSVAGPLEVCSLSCR